MLHNETRKLLIEAWNKTHNAKEIAEYGLLRRNDRGAVCRISENKTDTDLV